MPSAHPSAGVVEDPVRGELLSLLHRNLRIGVPLSCLGVGLFAFALAMVGPATSLVAWSAITLLSYAPFLAVFSSAVERRVRARRFNLVADWQPFLLALQGTAWGSAGALFFGSDHAHLMVLLVMLIANLTAVSMANVPTIRGVYAFCIPLVVPFLFCALTSGSPFALVGALTLTIVAVAVMGYAGQHHRVLVSAIRMRFENERLNEELTERRVKERTRALELASEHKSAFLATVSHEIRTPLNAIIGMSGLLADTPLTDEQREFAHIVRDSGESLLALINDILDYSKIEAGRMDIESHPFDPRECVESALDLVAPKVADRGLELVCHVDRDVPAVVASDPTRLRQILLNLLANAAKFTESGEVALSVSREGGDGLRFEVRDTGIGLTPDALARLFQAFSQADASTSRKYGGTGLGLAISRRLAEAMGGSMTARSDGPGLGSTFAFRIRAPAVTGAAMQRVPTDGDEAFRGKRVMVVEAHSAQREVLARQLADWAIDGHAVADMDAAIVASTSGGRWDAVILGFRQRGAEAVAQGRRLRERLGAVPLVLLAPIGRRDEAEDTVYTAVLSRPLHQSQLFDLLMTLFAGAAPSRRADRRPRVDPAMAGRHPLRILLAEDNAVNQKLAVRLLQQMGYRADVAGSGVEAVESVRRQRYDVVLMDVQMPEMDGLAATREIVGRHGDDRPRIVAMTANAMQGDREACLASGMDDYLTKPIRVEQLMQALASTPARRDPV